jgi:formate-dependent nitrite reductase cytochrome c552 subunit
MEINPMIVPNPDRHAAGLVVFTHERLVESLYGLSAALSKWEWAAATESTEEHSPEEIGELLLKQLQAAAEAASACTVKAPATEAAT